MLTNVLVSSFAPFPTLSLQLPSNLPAESTLAYVLSPLCDPSSQSISLCNGRSISNNVTIGSLAAGPSSFAQIRLAVRLPGGKGGFGSQLRAAGGRMNKKRGQENTDSCRDLNGRRLSTIKEAKKLAEYVSSAPEREAAKREESKARLAKLQEEIQRMDNAAGGNTSGSDNKASGSGAEATTSASKVGVKRRLDDQKFVEESREMVDNVKNAVAAAMMKKRKLGKTSTPVPSAPITTSANKDAASQKVTIDTPDASEVGEPSSAASASTSNAAAVSASA